MLAVLSLALSWSPPDQKLMSAAASRITEDDQIIDNLISRHQCSHVYLDVGTNIGVQIRKVYQPELYPKALVLRSFSEAFGPTPRCQVCTFGFEPNPRHSARLEMVQQRLTSAGVGVHIFHAAASDADGVVEFGLHNVTRKRQLDDRASSLSIMHRRFGLSRKSYVRSIDLARVIRRVDLALARVTPRKQTRGNIYMKLCVTRRILTLEPCGP